MAAPPVIPDEVRALVAERERARAGRDFARADDLRDQIEAKGFVLRDTPEGSVVEPAATADPLDPRNIESTLDLPATCDASIHLLYEGFPDDLTRFVDAFLKNSGPTTAELVVVDNASADGARLEEITGGFPSARVLHLATPVGWAAARNAGLKTSAGEIVVLADLSIEPTGDVLLPLVDAFEDDSVAVAGPFGLVSEDMRSWHEDPGPEVDAIEGYLMAFRRGALIHEKFTWYRNADIDLSFQLRAGGGRALVVPLPVRTHVHRGWSALDDDERARRSKRNHYVFFDRWKARTDLLTRAP